VPGRKPKPTNIKRLEGNPGKRPLNELEPEPMIDIPPCPPHLSDIAKIEWDRITRELEVVGIISQLDMVVVAGYCQDYARWVELEQNIKTDGIFIEIEYLNKKGDVFLTKKVINPAVVEARHVLQQLRMYASELGLSPVARPKLQSGLKKKSKDLMGDIIGMTG